MKLETWIRLMELVGFVDVSQLLGSGVYALCFREEVVYVGQAKKLWQRIYAHRNLLERVRSRKALPSGGRAKAIPFSKALIYPCQPSDLDRIEKAMIAKYRPRYNVNHMPAIKKTLAELEVALNVNGIVLNLLPAHATSIVERRI